MTRTNRPAAARPSPSLRLLWLGLCVLAASAGASAAELKIGGTGAGLGGLHRLGEAFAGSQGDSTVTVLPSMGSSGGIKAVIAGALTVAVSGRPLTPDELAAGASAVKIGRTPFVIAVPAAASAKALTVAQVADHLAGRTMAWPDGTPSRPVLRPRSDSNSGALRAMGPAMGPALDLADKRGGLHVALTDQECADRIAATPGGFGPSTLGLMLSEHRPLRALAIDGVVPSVQSVADGRYPHGIDLWLVAGAHSGPLGQAFIAYVRSPAGRSQLAELGVAAP